MIGFLYLVTSTLYISVVNMSRVLVILFFDGLSSVGKTDAESAEGRGDRREMRVVWWRVSGDNRCYECELCGTGA